MQPPQVPLTKKPMSSGLFVAIVIGTVTVISNVTPSVFSKPKGSDAPATSITERSEPKPAVSPHAATFSERHPRLVEGGRNKADKASTKPH